MVPSAILALVTALSAILTVATASFASVLERATLPVPVNPTALAVTSPVILKFLEFSRAVAVEAFPVTAPSKLATTVPAVPEKTSLQLVASGMKVNLPVLSSNPKNPSLPLTPLCHLNSIPLSLLSLSPVASPPNVNTGSSTVTTVELMV